MKHANLGASSASRWMACTSSPSLIETLDPELRNRSSIFAEEGSAAHYLAERLLRTALADYFHPEPHQPDEPTWEWRNLNLIGATIAKPADPDADDQWNDEDDYAFYGFDPFLDSDYLRTHTTDPIEKAHAEYRFVVDEVMNNAVFMYVETIMGFVQQSIAWPSVRVEQMTYPLPGNKEVFGTADCIVHDTVGGTIWVVDFKYGQGVKVTAQKNAQAMFYAAGALQHARQDPEVDYALDDIVNIVIVQPRVEFADGRSISDWSLTVKELSDWARTELYTAVENTSNPALAKYEVGSYCRWCPAAAICPLMQSQAIEQAQQAFGGDLETLTFENAKGVELIIPSADDCDGIAEALKVAAVLDNWSKKVKELADVQAKNENKLPGFKLVRKRTNRKWQNEDALIEELRAMGTLEEAQTIKIKSPTQLEKAGFDKDFVAERSHKPEGGVTVVPDTDPRKEASTAISAFSEEPVK